jgi:hypothetical protein
MLKTNLPHSKGMVTWRVSTTIWVHLSRIWAKEKFASRPPWQGGMLLKGDREDILGGRAEPE